MSKVQAKLTADDVTLSPRIGEYGLYRTATGEYVRKFRDGFRTVPFYESCLTVEGYPARTDIGVSYIAVVRFHIGPSGEYIEVWLATQKYRILKSPADLSKKNPTCALRCHIRPLDDFRFYGTEEEPERTDRYIRRELRRFQIERDKPDYGAVRGVNEYAPITCLSYRFCQHSREYFCDFAVKFHPELAALVVPCKLRWIRPPVGESYWDYDLAPRIGFTPEERRPTEQRLLAALFERLQDDAGREDEAREAEEWRRIQEYRAEVRQSTGETITPGEARKALGLSTEQARPERETQ
jgi:hypothetical protein